MTTNFRSLIFRLVFFGKINSYIFATSSRSSHQRCSVKKAAFNIFAIFAGKNLCWSLYLIRLQAWRPATLLKSDSNAGSSCKYCKIINNTYFEEHPWTTASELWRLPVLLLYPIQIYMSVLITNMVLTAWGPSHLSQILHLVRIWLKLQYLISEKEVLGTWNVILTKRDICLYIIWYTY